MKNAGYGNYEDEARLEYGRLLWKNPRIQERLIAHWTDPRHPHRERFRAHEALVRQVLDGSQEDDPELDLALRGIDASLRTIAREIPPVFGSFWSETGLLPKEGSGKGEPETFPKKVNRPRSASIPIKKLTDPAKADLQWLSDLIAAQGLQPNTRLAYGGWARRLVWFLQGQNKLLRHLDSDRVMGFMARLEQHSVSARVQARAAIRSFLKALALAGRLPSEAPQWADPVTQEKPPVRKPQSLSDEEMGRLLAILKASKNIRLQGRREYAFFSILFRLGMRISDLLNLQRSNCVVGQEGKVIELELDPKGGRQFTYSLAGDDGKLTETGKILDEWLSFRARIAKYEDQRRFFMRSKEWRDSQFVFPSQKGRAMTYRVVQRRFPDLARQAKISQHVSPHILRHSFAMFMRRQGTPIQVLQQLLNHSNISSTMQYVEVQEEEKRKAREKIEGFSIGTWLGTKP